MRAMELHLRQQTVLPSRALGKVREDKIDTEP